MGKYNEPWGRGVIENNTICTRGGEGMVIHRPVPDHQQLSGLSMDRVIACVNACEGIEDPKKAIDALKLVKQTIDKSIAEEELTIWSDAITKIGNLCNQIFRE